MKQLFYRIYERINDAVKRLMTSGVPYLRKDLLNRQFLVYAIAALLLSVISFPNSFVEFNSATMLPCHKIAGLFLQLDFLAPVLIQFVMLLFFYALALFIPVKPRAVILSLIFTGITLYTLGNAYMVIR